MNASGKSDLPVSDALNRFANLMRRLVLMSLGRLLVRLHFSPNATTLVGATIFVAGCFLWTQHPWLGLSVAFIGAWFDVADGAVVKLTQNRTVFGGILDSSMDRIMDMAMFMALALVLDSTWEDAICWVAACGAFLVSYSRSRADVYKIRGNIGIGGREIRLPVMAIGVMLGMIFDWRYIWAPIVVGVMSWSTAAYRLLYLRKQLIRQNRNKLPT
jgi:phosphatidylglycerophosphate synthase